MITSKTALIAAMKAAPGCKLYGHHGPRPASPWKYRLEDAEGKEIDRVSQPLVHRCAESKDIRLIRSDWLHCLYRLTARHRIAAAEDSAPSKESP